jgi:predicted DNA-binding transcriptional regulator AlpA
VAADPRVRLAPDHTLAAEPPAPAPSASSKTNGPQRSRCKRRLSPLVADARRLARLLCCGLRSIRTWDAAGKLPRPIKLGVRVVWVLSEIRAWLAAGAPPREEWEAMKRVQGGHGR